MRNAIAMTSLSLTLALTVSPPGAGVAAAQQAGTVVASGLNGPMGVLAASDGSMWVVETGVGGDQKLELLSPTTGQLTPSSYGQTSRIIRINPDRSTTEVARLPSVWMGPADSFGGARLAMLGDTLYVTSGARSTEWELPWSKMAAVVRIHAGQVNVVADLWEIESTQNPDGFSPIDSNPYGLAVGPDRNLWVTDAAGNTLLKVDPSTGAVELVTVFETLPSPIPNPLRGGKMVTDAVPTGVAFDADGNLYVSLLPGFPFVPGSAKVVRVTSDGEVSDYATGLTMLTDLRLAPDGRLYAVSLGRFTEQGPVPNSGAVVRIEEGAGSREVLTGLSFPTSIDFNAAGDAYVTINGLAVPGTGQVVMYEGLAKRAGTTR